MVAEGKTVLTGELRGLEGVSTEVSVELVSGWGWSEFCGGPLSTMREVQVRVHSALTESGFRWPANPGVRVQVPRYGGSSSDLAVAWALLCVTGQVEDKGGVAMLGELGLDGRLRPVRGVGQMLRALRNSGVEEAIVPEGNAFEAGRVPKMTVRYASHLSEVARTDKLRVCLPQKSPEHVSMSLDYSDVSGHEAEKAALLKAAQEGGNILLIGPPGSSKTMLARRFSTLLPSMTDEECREVTEIYSASGLLARAGWIAHRPFRAPHHTISDVGLCGGGVPTPRPGELTLAHHGVLFLDDVQEFRRLEVEEVGNKAAEKHMVISRRSEQWEFPCDVRIIASAMPCACGYRGSSRLKCVCNEASLDRYLKRLEEIQSTLRIRHVIRCKDKNR